MEPKCNFETFKEIEEVEDLQSGAFRVDIVTDRTQPGPGNVTTAVTGSAAVTGASPRRNQSAEKRKIKIKRKREGA